MKTTRRGLFAWLGALTGAAAVSRVVPAEASLDEMAASVVRNSKLPSHQRPVYRLLETTAGPAGAGDGYLGTETVTYPLHKAAPPLMCHGYPDELKPHERGEHFCSVCLTLENQRAYERQLLEQHGGINSVMRGPSYGSLDERCPGHRRGCDLGMGHSPYNKCSGYEPGSGGWTIGDLKNEAT